jgi:hypothetical protein
MLFSGLHVLDFLVVLDYALVGTTCIKFRWSKRPSKIDK